MRVPHSWATAAAWLLVRDMHRTPHAASCRLAPLSGSSGFPSGSCPAESVAVAPDGTLWMLDKFGYAHTATLDEAADEYQLCGEPVAYVGPGRPLGFHFDAAGNLVICDSLKASAGGHDLCRGHHLPARSGDRTVCWLAARPEHELPAVFSPAALQASWHGQGLPALYQ